MTRLALSATLAMSAEMLREMQTRAEDRGKRELAALIRETHDRLLNAEHDLVAITDMWALQMPGEHWPSRDVS